MHELTDTRPEIRLGSDPPKSAPSEAPEAKMNNWTDERVERLKELWARNYSAAMIALDLGVFSRSSVLGKVHRLGLPSHRDATKVSKERPRAKEYRPHRPSGYVLKRPRLIIDNFKAEECLEARHLTFDQLERGDCRYPFGEGAAMTFCGNPVKQGSSYCRKCHDICWVKPLSPKTRFFRTAA